MSFRSYTVTRWQQICLSLIYMLSTTIRLLPRQAALSSGPYSWIAALLSFIPMALIFWLTDRAFRNAEDNDGLAQVFTRALGNTAGKIVVGLFSVWLILYLSVTMKTMADKYISSSYVGSSPVFFLVLIFVLAFIAVQGRFPVLPRCAEAFFPLIALVMLLIFAMGVRDIDTHNLPPMPLSGLPEMLSGIPTLVASQSVAVYLAFLEGNVIHKEKRRGTSFLFLVLMVISIALLCLTSIGIFGSELTGRLSFPFFVMVRNLSVFNFMERIESAVIGLWVISDFILTAALIFIIVSNLRLCFGYGGFMGEKAGFFCMKDGRWLNWAVGALVLGLSIFLFSNSFELADFFNTIVPAVNLGLVFAVLPLTLFIGLLRKKL